MAKASAVVPAAILVALGASLIVGLMLASPRSGPSLLLVPQPAYYPLPYETARGSMLAADPDADGDGEAEDEAEGRDLADLEVEADDETGKNFPFPAYARPVHAAKVDQFGRILENGNCAINSWDTHNLWPHVRDPDSDAEEYATLHSDAQKLLGTTYNFPQNADCLSSPKGTPPNAVVSHDRDRERDRARDRARDSDRDRNRD